MYTVEEVEEEDSREIDRGERKGRGYAYWRKKRSAEAWKHRVVLYRMQEEGKTKYERSGREG